VLDHCGSSRLDRPVVGRLCEPPQAVTARHRGRDNDHTGEGQQHRRALAVRGAGAVPSVGGGNPDRRGPYRTATALGASEVCSEWRPWPRQEQAGQRATGTRKRVTIGRGSGRSIWYGAWPVAGASSSGA
jgi:hypothetical protein